MLTPASNQAPTDWYTTVGRRLARHIASWDAMPAEDRLEWVGDVVDKLETGASRITIPASMTADGVEHVVRLPDGTTQQDGADAPYVGGRPASLLSVA